MAVKAPPPITAAYLERATAWYLERNHTTTSHLKRLLMQRVRASIALHGGDARAFEGLVDAEIARLVRIGLLNDAAYAEDKARTLHRRGSSASKIRTALSAKGLRGELVKDALAALGTDLGEGRGARDAAAVEYEAALAYAKKRRIGPFRTGPVDRDGAHKELAKLGRAGFSYAIARRIIDAEAEDDGADGGPPW